MKRANLVKYSLLLALAAAFAVTAVTWAGDDDVKPFNMKSLSGRYISAENAYDVSSVHAFAAPDGSLVGPPVFFATAAVMVADGNGKVCGEADGFYGGTPPPGVNLGPSLFHGTYTVEDVTGRVTIETASDGAPGGGNVFCGTTATIDTTGKTVFKTQVGYLQNHKAEQVSTVEQINASDASKGGCCATSGFLVHHRNWTRD